MPAALLLEEPSLDVLTGGGVLPVDADSSAENARQR